MRIFWTFFLFTTSISYLKSLDGVAADEPKIKDTPFFEECSSRDFFLPFQRGKFALKSTNGVECPAPRFVRVGLKTDKYYNLQDLISDDQTLPGTISLLALRQDSIPNKDGLHTLTDFSVICSSLLFIQDSFFDNELRSIYTKLFHSRQITLDSLLYLNFPRLLTLNPGLTIDEFISIVFKKFPEEDLLVEYFRYWISDGTALPYHFNNFAVDSSDWTPVLKGLLETLDDPTWFNMNFYMKRAVMRASYNSPMRARLDAYRADLRKKLRDKKDDQGLPKEPFALKQIVLLDPVRAIVEMGFPMFDYVKELSSDFACSSLQERTWFIKNAPDFKTFLQGKNKITEVISVLRKEKHLPDPYILESLTVAVARQPILDIAKEAFEGYNHIILPLPNIWKLHPIKELAKYLTTFDGQKAIENPKVFKLPLLMLRSIMATIDVQSYLKFEKACMDAYIEEKFQAEKAAKDIGLKGKDSAKDAAKDAPKDAPKDTPKGATPAPTVTTGDSPVKNLFSAGVDSPTSSPAPAFQIPGLNPPKPAEEVALGRNINSKGEPDSYILLYAYRITDLLQKNPHAKEILLESDENLAIFMERSKLLERSSITATDLGTRMYFKVLQSLEDVLLTYKIIPPPPPPTPEELNKKKLEKQLLEEEERRKKTVKQKTSTDGIADLTLKTFLALVVAVAALY